MISPAGGRHDDRGGRLVERRRSFLFCECEVAFDLPSAGGGFDRHIFTLAVGPTGGMSERVEEDDESADDDDEGEPPRAYYDARGVPRDLIALARRATGAARGDVEALDVFDDNANEADAFDDAEERAWMREMEAEANELEGLDDETRAWLRDIDDEANEVDVLDGETLAWLRGVCDRVLAEVML